MFFLTWMWSISPQIPVLTARHCELVTDLSNVWWLESLHILQHWSVQSSQEMGHSSGVWPLWTFIEIGMALNILSSPSLGNGIGSDFQNKWRWHLYANPFYLQVEVDLLKLVPDKLRTWQTNLTVMDTLLCGIYCWINKHLFLDTTLYSTIP